MKRLIDTVRYISVHSQRDGISLLVFQPVMTR